MKSSLWWSRLRIELPLLKELGCEDSSDNKNFEFYGHAIIQGRV